MRVPVKVLGTLDGQWQPMVWKTDALDRQLDPQLLTCCFGVAAQCRDRESSARNGYRGSCRSAVTGKLQHAHTDFGERRTVHRASLGWLWWLVLCVAPILLVTAVAAVYAVMSITPNSSGNVVGAFGCLGGSGLLLAIVGGAAILLGMLTSQPPETPAA